MLIIGLCLLMLAGGLAAIVAWGGTTVSAPAGGPARTRNSLRSVFPFVAGRVLWWTNVLLIAGAVSGLLIAGAGGRLIMRLLAVTSDPSSQGMLTEAGQRVGTISLQGTISFIYFAGLFGGVLSALLYAALYRWLPRGRWGGVLLGGLLLVLGATTVEPLRPDNFDFLIVDPPWLTVTTFTLLVLAQGMAVVAVAGWLSGRVPVLTSRADLRSRRVLAYLPLPVLLLLLTAGGVVVVAAMIVALVIGLALSARVPQVKQLWARRFVTLTGRLLVIALALAALPGFIDALLEILTV